MTVFKTAIISNEDDVAQRLEELGVTAEQIISVGLVARARQNDASPLMPINAPGSLAYIFGVEEMRQQISGSDWYSERKYGVEAIVNRKSNIRIAYQNVDEACSITWKPKPRSAKGTGSENLCSPTLFEHAGVDAGPLTNVCSDGLTTYYIMVGENGGIELSCPVISNKTFAAFIERIFVYIPSNELDEVANDNSDSPIEDFEISVSLKESE
ncbi:hypothetical protein F9L33_12220 [Amylibacter sp. SFDW26]|uniref:hypothetical protein n=1 Tax=Amylibacter sp. SFDW26 TaxID=2652722 RepID=UPI001261AEAD|nr:hypothetical protein [Amylibacter sp. SFDW26]KAB7613361.1 hypothetical protein F9L33_12220 [Amylibacter sp. SFDW26]